MTSPPNVEPAEKNLRHHEDELPDDTQGRDRLWREKEKRFRSPRGSSRSAAKKADQIAQYDVTGHRHGRG